MYIKACIWCVLRPFLFNCVVEVWSLDHLPGRGGGVSSKVAVPVRLEGQVMLIILKRGFPFYSETGEGGVCVRAASWKVDGRGAEP